MDFFARCTREPWTTPCAIGRRERRRGARAGEALLGGRDRRRLREDSSHAPERPTLTLDRLVALGEALVREQEHVNTNKLAEEYTRGVREVPGRGRRRRRRRWRRRRRRRDAPRTARRRGETRAGRDRRRSTRRRARRDGARERDGAEAERRARLPADARGANERTRRETAAEVAAAGVGGMGRGRRRGDGPYLRRGRRRRASRKRRSGTRSTTWTGVRRVRGRSCDRARTRTRTGREARRRGRRRAKAIDGLPAITYFANGDPRANPETTGRSKRRDEESGKSSNCSNCNRRTASNELPVYQQYSRLRRTFGSPPPRALSDVARASRASPARSCTPPSATTATPQDGERRTLLSKSGRVPDARVRVDGALDRARRRGVSRASRRVASAAPQGARLGDALGRTASTANAE